VKRQPTLGLIFEFNGDVIELILKIKILIEDWFENKDFLAPFSIKWNNVFCTNDIVSFTVIKKKKELKTMSFWWHYLWRPFLSHTQIPKNLTQRTPFSWPTILMKTRGDKPYEGLPNHPIFIFNIKLKKNLKRVNI
jgi:hypothetical protein